jgi:RNA polymerase sigma-70 factor (ECF subfamily)
MDLPGESYYIERVKAGEREAFSWLVGKYQDMVYTLCLRMLSNEADAMDAAQEVFVKAFRSMKSFQERSKFSTWLYRIAYNHCISVIRRNVKVIDLVDELPDEEVGGEEVSGIEALGREERARYLRMALEALPETDAVVVTLFYFEELSLDEIAEVTGLTGSNIRIKLHRSRKKMYKVLSEKLRSELNSMVYHGT